MSSVLGFVDFSFIAEGDSEDPILSVNISSVLGINDDTELVEGEDVLFREGSRDGLSKLVGGTDIGISTMVGFWDVGPELLPAKSVGATEIGVPTTVGVSDVGPGLVPGGKEGRLLPLRSEGLSERFGLGLKVGFVLPTDNRLLGEIVVGPVLFSIVGGLNELVGPKLPPGLSVGPPLLIVDGDSDKEALGNLVDSMPDALCTLGISVAG